MTVDNLATTTDRPNVTSALNIKDVRRLFVDPERPGSSDLERLAAISIRTMGQIYLTGGRIDLMDYETRAWLQKTLELQGIGNAEAILGRILVSEASTRKFDNKFFGQIHPQGNTIGILSSLIAAYMNTNSVVKEVSQAENVMESEVLGWLADMFGYDRKEYSGNVVTGGTSANITALWVARNWKLAELKTTLRESGPLYVVVSSMKHYSLVKACDLLGLDLVEVPSDGLKSSVAKTKEALKSLDLKKGKVAAIVSIAGGTETGMVDDINGFADLAKKYNAHLHVDAAYGGPFILTKEGYRFNGIARADSISIDPHKMLYTPYSSAAVLFRDKARHALIEASMRDHAGYLSPKEIRAKLGEHSDVDRNFGFSRLEGSMGTAGVISAWSTIKLMGRDGIAALLEHTLDLTGCAHECILSSRNLEVLHEPETNTLLFGIKGLESRGQVMRSLPTLAKERVEAKFGFYISTDDSLFDHPVFRFVAMHPYSTREDVAGLISELDKEVDRYLNSDGN